MKRIVIALLLVVSAVAGTTAHVSASGIAPNPLLGPAGSGHSPDYFIAVSNCQYEPGTSCGLEYAFNDSSAQVGPPTGGAYLCEQFTQTGFRAMIVVFGNFSQVFEGDLGTGTVGGVAGDLSGNAIYSNLAGKGTYEYFPYGTEGPGPYPAPASGSAVGIVKYGPVDQYGGAIVTSGKITISLRGTVITDNEGTVTLSQGSMTCSIGAGAEVGSLI